MSLVKPSRHLAEDETLDAKDLERYMIITKPKWYSVQNYPYVRRYRVIACIKYNYVNFGGLPYGYHVHHIDKSHSNDSPSNLWLCTAKEHHRLHALDDRAYGDWLLNHHSP